MTTVPQVTCLAARDGLNIAVGQVLLYDVRASKPVLTKDHMYGLPIKKVVYTEGHEQPMLLSMTVRWSGSGKGELEDQD